MKVSSLQQSLAQLRKAATVLTFGILTVLIPQVLPISQAYAQSDANSDAYVTKEFLDSVNPIKRNANPDYQDVLSTPGGIISRVLTFAFPIAGIILFVMIMWGGFEMVAGSASKKSMEAGRQRITAAIVGYLILFVSYWIIVLVQQTFGINIFYVVQ